MIDQIGEGVQELGQLARGLNEELQQQSIMIDGLEERIDTTQAHGTRRLRSSICLSLALLLTTQTRFACCSLPVESVNMKMKKTLAQVGRSADKCMMDMICLILLLGILTVVYNMFIKKKSS